MQRPDADVWITLNVEPTTDADALLSALRARLFELRRAGLHEQVQHVQPVHEAYEQAAAWARHCQEEGEGERGEEGGRAMWGTWAEQTPAPNEGEAAAWPQAAAPSGSQGDAPPVAPQPLNSDPHTAVVWAVLAQQAIETLLPNGVPPRAHRRLRALWAQPKWQVSAAAQALEQALARSLYRLCPALPAGGCPDADIRRMQRWLALCLQVAAERHWWKAALGPVGTEQPAQALWFTARSACVTLAMTLGDQGRLPAACAAVRSQLRHPALMGLELHDHLAQAYAEALVGHPNPPPALMVQIVEGFGLHERPDAGLASLEQFALQGARARYDLYRRQTLLHRIADGREKHREISAAVAQALLHAQVSAQDRRAALHGRQQGGLTFVHAVRLALEWLQERNPDALHPIAPGVAAWWQQAQLQRQRWWAWSAVACGAVTLSTTLRFLLLFCWSAHPAWWLILLLAATAGGAFLGWRGARGLVWLHMQWCTRWYPAWVKSDLALTARIPYYGRGLALLGLGLSRDLLVGLVLLYLLADQYMVALALHLGWRLVLGVSALGRY